MTHGYYYAQDGRSGQALDVLSTIFDMFSECMMTMLIFMMVNGWMTRFTRIDIDEGLEFYVPILILVIFVHVFLAAFSYLE